MGRRAAHALRDKWGPGATDAERIRNTPGAQDAIAQGTAILRLVRARASWEQARQHMEAHILATVPDPAPAGPGAEFLRAE